MTDERFEQLMRDAEKTYRVRRSPTSTACGARSPRRPLVSRRDTYRRAADSLERRGLLHSSRIRIAAALIVGVGLGRASMLLGRRDVQPRRRRPSPSPARQ